MVSDRSHADSLDGPTVERLVGEELGREVEAVDRVRAGNSAVYLVRLVGTPQTVVVKYCVSDEPGRFRVGARLAEEIGDRTDVPVPSVYSVGERDGSPYALLEYLPEAGVDLGEFTPDRQTAVARQIGRMLRTIHEARRFDAYGLLVASEKTIHPREQFETPQELHGAYLDMVWDRWPDSHKQQAIRDEIDAAVRALPSATPVIVHNDLTPQNVAVTDDGTVTGVFDWDSAMAASGGFELAKTEVLLSSYAPLDDPLRERVRTGLTDGYGDLTDAYVDHRETYLAINRIGALGLVDRLHDDATDEERAAIIDTHVETIRRLLDL